jgi:hypothetical protein
MGATSVTGVSGPGSAAEQGGGNKGSEHMSLAVHRLIGPRVVACGDVDLANNIATVYYPELPGTVDQYCVFLSTNQPTFPYWGDFTTTSFGVTGTTFGVTGGEEEGATVCWQIVKCGLWGSVTTGLENT